MSLTFENATPFSALHFEQIDQHDDAFHVFVARVAYTLGPADGKGNARLRLAEEPPELIEEDRYFGEMGRSAVQVESDLAPYKPRCDVIVNAGAHSPNGQPARQVHTRLTVQLPDTPIPLPEAPQGLNPHMAPSPKAMQAWREAVAQAQGATVPGQMLIDKTLRVTGERWLKRRTWPVRSIQALIAVATLGWLRPNPWRLTRATPFTVQPIRYDYAIGGESRIDAGDAAAGRVPKRQRLTPAGGAAIAVWRRASETNPVGRGYTSTTYLKATRRNRLPAPQIECPARPFRARSRSGWAERSSQKTVCNARPAVKAITARCQRR